MPPCTPTGIQTTFEDLGTPLHDVTFCVIDLETTGCAPTTDAITEIGAVKLRGGECLGTFQTLVNPARDIPPAITVLTGITQAMVVPAPRIEAVLPSLVEFVGDAVVVGHNVRFDLGFLRAAIERAERPPLTNRSVDTCSLARRLVRDEVPNCRLGTLSSRLRLDHQPSHRALDDAMATGDLLHVLLERAATLGVTGLDDLIALPKIGGHAQAGKLGLTTRLPREPGVYMFRDRAGEVLYVGKATNLRSRVRSYFSGDTRRKVGALLRETQSIDHVVCHHPLEAAVREIRLIHELGPRYNRQSKDWSRYRYLKLTLDEAFPRLSVVRAARDDGCLYLGPLPSTSFAKRVVEAIETAVPLRRCAARPGARRRSGACAPAQLGVAACPCTGTMSADEYAPIVELAVVGIVSQPEILLAPLRQRMAALAGAERFEEAADVRDRAAALSTALRRQRQLDMLRRAGRVLVEVPGRGGAELCEGRLVRAWQPGANEPLPLVSLGDTRMPEPAPGDSLPRELADEVLCVARWLDSNAGSVRLVHTDAGLVSALPRVDSFDPRTPGEASLMPGRGRDR